MTPQSGSRRGTMERQTLLSPSLHFKLLVFAAVLVVVPGMIFGLIAYFNSRSFLEQVIGRHLTREAATAANRFADTLRFEREGLSSAAQQDLMRELRVGDIDKRVSAFLTTLKDADSNCVDLAVTDSQHRIIAASAPALIDGTPSWLSLAAKSLQDGGAFVGPSEIDRSGRQTIVLATPVYDPDAPSTAIGTLIGVYDWDRLTSVTRSVRKDLRSLGFHADVLITNQDGTVLKRSPEANDRPDREPTLAGSSPDSSPRPTGENSAAAQPPAGMPDAVLVGRGRLGKALPDWEVRIVEPVESAFAPVERMAGRLAWALAVTLIVALGIATIGARRVSSPIRELTAAIRGLGKGHGSVSRVPVRTRDEVGALASEFNRMAADLDRAQKELVEAAKFAFAGELAAGVAHEVRTPLGVLRTSAQILERSLPPDQDAETKELVQMMRAEVDRVDRVVNELLNLARPRHMQLAPTPLSAPVFRAADFVERQAKEKRIEVVRVDSGDPSLVACDPELIYQVALNLLVNAIQALEAGGRIEIALLPRSGRLHGFEIRDDGPGIPEEVGARVFQPFVALRQGGTGLGLTFVQRVVQEHGGRVTLTTATGRGTCFRVELPITERSA